MTKAVEDKSEIDSRYRAPALEKGLDILELLATEARPMTLTAIVNRLERSHGELFRMVQVLEFRGYIEQDPSNEGYRLTDRLFSLGMQQPRTRNLIEAALPVMRQLASTVGQSCHLALHTQGEMVVVARMESSEQLGFSVRVGYRRPLVQAASGLVLYAFQPEDVRRRWESLLDPQLSDKELAAFRDACRRDPRTSGRTHAEQIRRGRHRYLSAGDARRDGGGGAHRALSQETSAFRLPGGDRRTCSAGRKADLRATRRG